VASSGHGGPVQGNLPPASRKSGNPDEVFEADKATGVSRPVKIWVDADACPVVIKDILFRAAKRTKTMMTLVANQPIQVPNSPFIRTIQVASGFDVADNEIVRRLDAGDLVITADIPLAAEVIAKGGHALNPRGELYTTENIRGRLNMRDFLDTMRASGVNTGGPPAISQRDRQDFANNLDRFLAKSLAD
jgi:uncharacterized protein